MQLLESSVKGAIGVGEEMDQVRTVLMGRFNLLASENIAPESAITRPFFSLDFRDVIHNLGICQIGYRDFVF